MSARYLFLVVPSLFVLSSFASAQRSGTQPPPVPLLSNCQPQWFPSFGSTPGVDGTVRSLLAFDDGSGPALFTGGDFTHAGGQPVVGLARWNGEGWSQLGAGLSGALGLRVNALCVFDDGHGPAVYAAGDFVQSGALVLNGIGRWNGTSWSALAGGVTLGGSHGRVHSLCVFDEGSGARLFASGEFDAAGGVPAAGIARWNGAAWSSVGTGGLFAAGSVAGAAALCVHDDGSGRALYAGGAFDSAGGVLAEGIARWNGTSWSAVGSGMGGPDPSVASLASWDDGSGAKLFAGGEFTFAGGQVAQHVARWNGSAWSNLGQGTSGAVKTFLPFDDGSGTKLYAGGNFLSAGGLFSRHVARWNGTQWSTVVGLDVGSVLALAVFHDAHGTSLHAGGSFSTNLEGRMLLRIAALHDDHWRPLGDGLATSVLAMAQFDDGNGPAVFVAGPADTPGGATLRGVGRWDGVQWHAAGNFNGLSPSALAVFDDGSGPALYAGGAFSIVDGLSALRVVRWNGSTWTQVGTGLPYSVTCFAVFDDGTGSKLYAGGNSGPLALNLRAWDGTGWQTLGGGLNGTVSALCTFDDGAGDALYVAGSFGSTTFNPHGIARWDGTNWSALGNGTDGLIQALAGFDDGTGPALYAGGAFTSAGTSAASAIARWTAGSWSAVGNGFANSSSQPPVVRALAAFDDGSGPALYATGTFDLSGAASVGHIARWRAGNWGAIGNGLGFDLNVSGRALLASDLGRGRALLVGGDFLSCPDSLDSRLASWGVPPGCGWSGEALCFPGEDGVQACPCGNPPSEHGRGCENSAGTGGARLDATGRSSLANDTLHLTTRGELGSAASIVLQGTLANPAGATFGQGVRCVGGTLRRLYNKVAVGGSIVAPGPGDLPIAQRSAALGDPIAQGQHRFYGVYYRDPNVLGSCPATSTLNATQELDVLWVP